MGNNIEENYQKGLNKENERKKTETATENIINFYNKNKEICDLSYKFYTEYNKNINKYVKKPIITNATTFRRNLKSANILVITANPIERGIFLRWLSEKNNAPLETFLVESNAYNIFPKMINSV